MAHASRSIGEKWIHQALSALPKELGVDCHPHDVQLHRDHDGLNISFHCVLDASESIADAHTFTERIEQALRDRMPGLGRVVIHVEPPEA